MAACLGMGVAAFPPAGSWWVGLGVAIRDLYLAWVVESDPTARARIARRGQAVDGLRNWLLQDVGSGPSFGCCLALVRALRYATRCREFAVAALIDAEVELEPLVDLPVGLPPGLVLDDVDALLVLETACMLLVDVEEGPGADVAVYLRQAARRWVDP